MFEKLLEKIALALDKAGIPYMVIGGQAVLLYGEPRLTRDIDITLGTTLEKLDDVLALIKEINLKPLVDPETFTRKTMVLPCSEEKLNIRLDLIFSYSSYEQEALQRVRVVSMGTAQVKFVSPEDLIIHKVISGRPRDLEDVKNVLLKNPDFDLSHVRKWLKEFSTELEEPLSQRFAEILEQIR